ncbi:MAG: hypothetical protein WCK21_04630 [Actinomycetota bacterium]
MFTTGSKLFFGASALSLASALLYAFTTEGPLSLPGVVGLLSVTVIFGFLGGINYANHDGNVSGMQEGAEVTSAAAQPPVSRSMWPLAAAVGTAGMVIGAVSKPVVFKVAVVVVLAAAVEWMVLGWSERASSDNGYNAGVRRRMLYPLEFPILGAVGLGAVAYAFSRVMLRVDKDAGKAIFGALGAMVLAAGFVFANKKNVTKRTVAGVCAIGAVALLGVGVASAVQGQRTIEQHPTTANDTAVCLEGGTAGEVDDNASQAVSAKSSVIANLYLQSNGVIVAYVNGSPNDAKSQIDIPRSAWVRVLFHNDAPESHRLTARLGTFGAADEVVQCTTAVHTGHEAFLDFKVPRTNAASTTPLVLMVPGLDGQEIKIVVP